MKAVFAAAILFIVGSPLLAQTQTDTSSRRFLFVGAGYTFTKVYDTTGAYWLDYSYTLKQSMFHGFAAEAIYHTRIPCIGFHLQGRYIHDHFARTTWRDPRLPYNGSSYDKTVYLTREHVVTIGTYFALTTKGENAWVFFELGPEISAGLAGNTTQTDYYRDQVATPTPHYVTTAIPRGSTESGFRIKAGQAGLRIGVVGNILNSWYGSAFLQGRFFGPRELIPCDDMGAVLMFNLGIYYRISPNSR